MEHPGQQASSAEAPFEVHELFFSRTNDAGIILSGNEVFVRISGYSWDELNGAPHKILRHGDMPAGAFFLMWEKLKAGQLTAAYVKNRTKDGRHYWVLAIISPYDNGYLSVRLKPVSDMRSAVETLYADVLLAEREDKLTPKDSAARLSDRLLAMGFPSYDAFAAEAMAKEIGARDEAMGGVSSLCASLFVSMSEAVRQIRGEATALSALFDQLRTTPVNMGVLASRLEASGGPISAISGAYGGMSQEIGAWVKDFIEDGSGLFASVESAIFGGMALAASSHIQNEMLLQFGKEPDMTGDKAAQMRALAAESERSAASAEKALRKIGEGARRLTALTHELKRHVTGLGATRMICKVEGARLSQQGESLTGVIAQLENFQIKADQRQAKIEQLTKEIQRAATAACQTKKSAA